MNAFTKFRHVRELFRWEKRLVARFVFTSFSRAGASMMVIFLTQEFLSAGLGQGGRITNLVERTFGHASVGYVLASLMCAAYLCGSWLNYDNRVTQQHTVKILELGMMQRLIRHLMTLSVPFFDRQSHGDLVYAVRQDVTSLRMGVHAATNIVLEGVLIIGMGVACVWLSPRLTLWALMGIPLVTIPVYFLCEKLRSHSDEIRKSGYILMDVILQILSGIRIIKAYQNEQTEIEKSIDRGRAYFDSQIEISRLRALATVLMESMAGLGMVIVVVIGGFEVKSGLISFPSLLAFVMAMRALHGPLNNVYTYYTELQTYSASVKRVNELLELTPEVMERANAIPLPKAPGSIRFDNVSFSYGGKTILHNLNFEVKAGETIGIVGPSGTGKSTLLNLLIRFYDSTSGVISFEGKDIRDYQMATVYQHVAIVTQEPFLFATTVRSNIQCGRPSATEDEVIQAARAAFVHEEIIDLPDGYDTPIGVGGRQLSRGQAQRINVARAILKRAPILLLDEATSSLDSISEAKVQDALDELVKGRSSFIVAHRLSTLRNADRLLVIDGGRCVGFATHDELMTTCEFYRVLWETQDISKDNAEAREPVLSSL